MEELAANALLSSYDINCVNVEKHALNTILSFEIAVFNGLRDASAQSCLKALGLLNGYYGLDRERITERCVCLTVLTEYICTSYRSNVLYKTFEIALSDKYVDKLFDKLYKEWLKLFRADLPTEFITGPQFQCVLKTLRSCFCRFSDTFRWKLSLQGVISLGENYVTNAKMKITNTQSTTFALKNQFPVQQEPKTSPVITNTIRSHFVPKPMKAGTYDITQYTVRKASTAPHECQNSRFSNFRNCIDDIIEARVPEEKPSASTSVAFSEHEQSHSSIKALSKASPVPQKKLNAFDILMKRKDPGSKILKMP